MIKEIIHSVSIIPDQITRNVYLQSIAERFDMNEQVLSNELIKLRKDQLAKSLKAPEFRDVPTDYSPKKPEQQTTALPVEDGDDPNEFDLMRILVLYGSLAITTDQIDEEGKKSNVEASVAELICHELNVDELVFENPIYNKMHLIITDALEENTLLKSSFFSKQEDQSIVRFISEIEMNQHELSHNWITKHNIYTNSEKDKLSQAVMGSIYSFKSSKVERKIRTIQRVLIEKADQLKDEELLDLLAEQVTLEQVKILISEKLGRIVIR